MRCIIFFIIGFISLFACKQSVHLKPIDLKGKWNFAKAFRNGKEAKTLENAYFEFQDDKSVLSNLFEAQGMATFTVDKAKLIIHDKTPLELDIIEFSNDSMHLTGKMNSFDMEFHLVKVDP